MKLTRRNKDYIDGLNYQNLLAHCRFAKVGDPWFEGETGEYWKKRMRELRAQPGGASEHVRASKAIGW